VLCIVPGKYFYSLFICLHSIVKTLLICGRYFRCAKFWYGPAGEQRPTELNDHGPLYLSPLRKESVDKISGVVLKNLFMSTFHHEFCHQMAAAVGLDVTKKHYTNHSIRKTTVKKLKKDGVSATEVMAITAHKNQQILADYDELDNADHMQLSRILSSEKLAASKQLAQVSLSALLSFLSC